MPGQRDPMNAQRSLPAPQAAAPPGTWPTWYNRGLSPIPGIDSDSLSTDSSSGPSSSSSSSSSSSRSSSADSGKEKPPKRPRTRRWRLKFSVHERLKRPFQPPPSYTMHEGERRRRTFVHVRQLLDERGVQLVHSLFAHPSVEEIKDRKDTLLYRHVAYRIELPLRAHGRVLYQHLIDAMVWADATVWRKLARNRKVYPEAEYIVYDARKGKPGEIEPHVDNDSAVSIVILLSDPRDFDGGVNCFAPAGERGSGSRKLALQKGDAVIFRGEKLQHWITPVTGGVRVILQIELSRV